MSRQPSTSHVSRHLSVLLPLLLLVVSCRQPPEPPPPPPELQVRVLTTSPVDEQLEQDARTGLERIAHELHAGTALVQGSDARSRRQSLRELGRTGADLVFCFGSALEPAVYTEARAYPDTRFVLLPGSSSADNVASILFLVEEAAFLGGVLADLLRQDRQVGMIEGEGGPWLTRVQEGFSTGLRSRAPRLELRTAGGPDAPWLLAEADVAVALYRADRADPAVLAAAHDAGLVLIVTDPRAVKAAPDVVAGLVVADLPEAMIRVAREVADGSFTPRVYAFDLGSGVVDLRLGPRLLQENAYELRDTLDRTRAGITAGWVEIEQLGI